MTRKTWLILAFLALPLPARAFGAEPITVRVLPDPVYVERAGDAQHLSFALELVNQTAAPLELTQIWMRAYDEAGRLLAWNKVDSNGSRPSIEVLGPRRLEPGKPLTVFNPFEQIDTAVPVALLRCELFFATAGGGREKATFEVRPVEYAQKTTLILPVPGARLWAYEAPHLYSHHARLDLTDPFNRDVLGIRSNSQRYALDLVVVDDEGEAFHGSPGKQESWVGFGVPVVAPAPGMVVVAAGDMPDDIPYDLERLRKEPMLMVGNHVVIDHGNGEYSALAHFRNGSLAVKAGDRVERGQLLGRMGRSGMGSGLVHVHYELRTSPDLFNAGGLPVRFQGFRRIGSPVPETGRIGPGWVVVTEPVAPAAPPPAPPPPPS